jgi:hypothetical protein
MLALILVQSVGDDAAVCNVNVWQARVALPRQSMLHPSLVVALLIVTVGIRQNDSTMTHLGIVLAGMSAA